VGYADSENKNEARDAAVAHQSLACRLVEQVRGVVAQEIDPGIENQGAHKEFLTL
jgi:hypothetical protein